MHEDERAGSAFLPDFCSGPPLLTLIAVIEMVALLLALASAPVAELLLERLWLLSLYLQWIGLCSAIVLCALRRRAGRMGAGAVAVLSYGALLLVTWIISEISFMVGSRYGLPLLTELPRHELLIRSLGVCAIVSALLLRYFWVQHQWRLQTLAQGESRYALLQARIRPHFLFNALNSIAALTGIKPAAAEEAIVDLSALLRATLNDPNRRVPLGDELALVQAYLRIEQHRLGERLRQDWSVDAPNHLLLPPLSLQPLVENAVRHGIERCSAGGTLSVCVQADSGKLRIEVRNPLPQHSADGGAGEALRNIEERLALLYGRERAQLSAGPAGGEFVARLHLPMES